MSRQKSVFPKFLCQLSSQFHFGEMFNGLLRSTFEFWLYSFGETFRRQVSFCSGYHCSQFQLKINFCNILFRSISSTLSLLSVLGGYGCSECCLQGKLGSIVVAGMKTIFAIFDPIWTYILALQAQNKELLEY